MAIKTLSKARFDAFCYARSPYAACVSQEVEWYADEKENVLGVVAHDKVDNDWAFVVLGRDGRSQFRAIALDASLPTQVEARHKLIEKMTEIEQTGETVFIQSNEKGKKNNLFEPMVPPDKLHPTFNILKDGPHHYPAQSIIREIFYHYVDPDKNFVEQFQTTGFDARI